MKLWLKLEDNPYHFPVEMAESAQELAEKCGANVKTVRSIAYRNKSGEFKNGKYACVEIDEGDDE